MEVKNFIPLFVTYKCTQCRRTVTTKHIVQETIPVSSQNTVVWQESPNHSVSSSEKSKIQHGRKLAKIYDEQEKGLYRLAEFDCKCPHCSHREPWSKMRYRITDTIFGALLPFGVLFALILFPVGISLLGIVVAYLLIKRIHRSIQEKEIRRLPQQSLPYFALTKEESIDLYNQSNKSNDSSDTIVQSSGAESIKAREFAQDEFSEIIKYWAQLYCVSKNEDLEQNIKSQVIHGLWQKTENEKGSGFVRKIKVFMSYINEDQLAQELDIINRFYNGEFKN